MQNADVPLAASSDGVNFRAQSPRRARRTNYSGVGSRLDVATVRWGRAKEGANQNHETIELVTTSGEGGKFALEV